MARWWLRDELSGPWWMSFWGSNCWSDLRIWAASKKGGNADADSVGPLLSTVPASAAAAAGLTGMNCWN